MRSFMTILAVFAACAAHVRADDGTLIVLNKAEASASLINLEHGKEVKRVPVGEGPHEVAVSPDGRVAVVADYGAREGGNTLTVIDVINAQPLSTIDLGNHRRPHGIVYLDERRVIVTTEASQSVQVVDIVDGLVLHTISTGQQGTHMVAVTPDRTRAFTANMGSDNVTALDLTEMKVIGQILTGDEAEGIDISPDGKEVWVSNRREHSISIIDVESLNVLEKIECGRMPIRVKFTPDGSKVLVSNAQSGEVAIFDATTRQEIARTKIELPGSGEQMLGSQGPVPIGILFTPSGDRAFVASANADVVSVIDTETWTIQQPLIAGKQPDGLAYSPLTVGVDPDASTTNTYGS